MFQTGTNQIWLIYQMFLSDMRSELKNLWYQCHNCISVHGVVSCDETFQVQWMHAFCLLLKSLSTMLCASETIKTFTMEILRVALNDI